MYEVNGVLHETQEDRFPKTSKSEPTKKKNASKYMLYANEYPLRFTILHVHIIAKTSHGVIVQPIDDCGIETSYPFSVRQVAVWRLFDTQKDARKELENILLGFLKDVQNPNKKFAQCGPTYFDNKNEKTVCRKL